MLCQKCGLKQATTHIHTVINGVASEIDLCSKCAAESGYSTGVKNPLVDMLATVFGDNFAIDNPLATVKCECCGSNFSDIAHTGKVGCSLCYKTFKKEIFPYIKRVHGTTKHIGKKPNNQLLVIAKTDEIALLREKLRDLVAKEKFEEAAVLRDKIKKVEEENDNE